MAFNRTRIAGRIAAGAVIAVLVVHGVAWAESVVYGYGSSRTAAINDANMAARELARSRGTCFISPSQRPEWCVQDNGEWRCKAEVAKYNRSNPGGICP